MLVKAKSVKQIIKEAGKQATPEFVGAFDKRVSTLLCEIIAKAKNKRLTTEDIA